MSVRIKFNAIASIAICFIVNVSNAQWPASYDYTGYDDEARGIAIDTAGYVAIAGYVTNSGGLRGRVTIRYNSAGQQLWYDLGWSAGNSELDAVAMLSNGDIVVTGSAYPSTNEDIYVAYYDKNSSSPQWEETYDGGEADRGKGIAVDINDNIIVVGYSYLTTGDIYLIKYNSSGTVIWEKRHDLGGFETPEDVAVDYAGNIIICGEKLNTNLDYLIIKCNSSGNIIWTKEFDGGSIDYAHGISTDLQGNIIVTGRMNNGTNYDYWTIKLNASGTTMWQDIHNTNYNDLAHDVCVDMSDSIVVVGSSYNTSTSFFNHHILKYAPGGTIGREIWDGVDTDVMGNSVALSSSGHGFVTGYLDNPSEGYNIFTQRYPGLGYGIYYGIEDHFNQNINANNVSMNIRLVFRNSFLIDYYRPQSGDIRLDIYNILGCNLVTLKQGQCSQGWHSIQWNCTDKSGKFLPSGVYFCRLTAGKLSVSKKMVVCR